MLDTIYDRRSIRKYLDKPVDEKTIAEIIKAGMYAPSAVNKQPWHFIVITEKTVMRDIKNLHPYAASLETAPVAIMVCGDTALEFAPNFYLTDCAAVTENILLAAKWLGLDAGKLNIVAQYNLLYNASVMAAKGLGYAIGLDGIVDTSPTSGLCFRPLFPKLESGMSFVWKKGRHFSTPASLFLEKIKQYCKV